VQQLLVEQELLCNLVRRIKNGDFNFLHFLIIFNRDNKIKGIK
jgi:hypothetical protein